MNPKQKLKETFPEFFDANTEVGVPDGWYEIVRNTLTQIAAVQDNHFKVLQIKEKFGGLRIYGSYAVGLGKQISPLLDAAETESYKVCEDCGTKEKVTTEPLKGGHWILTLCEGCRKEK